MIVGAALALGGIDARATAVGLGMILGGVRLPIWLLHLLAMFLSTRWAMFNHPLWNDEMGILPFPYATTALVERFHTEPDEALMSSRSLLANPFRAALVGQAVSRYLNECEQPLTELYRLLSMPTMDEVSVEPLDKYAGEQTKSLRFLFLARLANIFVQPIENQSATAERMVSSFLCRFYPATEYPLYPLLLVLVSLEAIDRIPLPFAQAASQLEDVYYGRFKENLSIWEMFRYNFINFKNLFPGSTFGQEVNNTFYLLQTGLFAGETEDIVSFYTEYQTAFVVSDEYLRPDVVAATSALADISQEVQRYAESSSSAIRAAAINRAVGMLAELSEYVSTIRLSERVLLRAVVEKWQGIVAEAAQRLGEQSLREMGAGKRRQLLGGENRLSSLWQRPALPFESPYVAGPPVRSPLFVGRSDIFNRILERWQGDHTPDSIILYGHRRMGKTSILHGLKEYAPPNSLLVTLDMKGERATARHLGDLLLELADRLYDAASPTISSLTKPDPANYAEPATAKIYFQRLLRAVGRELSAGGHIIIALDEFEALQEGIEKGTLPVETYDLIRTLSQQEGVALVLAGLHTLDEMSRDYQQSFYSSFVNIKVSYLTPAASEQLIARPTQDFPVNYHREVIDEIHRLTYGQPLLIQRICQELISHLNHELFDLEIDREARILPADLDTILTDDFLLRETQYFDGVWNSQIADFPDQQAILFALAAANTAQSTMELAAKTNLSVEVVNDALHALARRDILAEEDGKWSLLMPLFRRWLLLKHRSMSK